MKAETFVSKIEKLGMIQNKGVSHLRRVWIFTDHAHAAILPSVRRKATPSISGAPAFGGVLRLWRGNMGTLFPAMHSTLAPDAGMVSRDGRAHVISTTSQSTLCPGLPSPPQAGLNGRLCFGRAFGLQREVCPRLCSHGVRCIVEWLEHPQQTVRKRLPSTMGTPLQRDRGVAQ